MASIKGTNENDNLLGTPSPDSIWGYGGDDILSGGNGNDDLSGGLGNDFLSGGAFADSLIGGAGDDVLYGGASGDVLYGGTGGDVLYGGNGYNGLSGGAGNDKLYGGAYLDVLVGGAGNDVLYGGAEFDILDGGLGNDVLYGGENYDSLTGGEAGDDVLYGGAGGDNLEGMSGNDFLYGEAGNDDLRGGTSRDKLFGGLGDDTLNGNDGVDTLNGGLGNDKLDGETGNDTLNGEAGNDKLAGGIGSDFLFGGNDNDSLSGGDQNDELYGEAGNDLLEGGFSNDALYGGDGNDKLYGDWQFRSTSDLESENDTLVGGAGHDLLYGQEGDDQLFGGADQDRLLGGSGKNYLSGGTGEDLLSGGSGNDKLVGNAGNDILLGVNKSAAPKLNEIDTLTGGAGADTFILGDSNSVFYDDVNPVMAGKRDYALITDFNPNEDKIQLTGSNSASAYRYYTTEASGVPGVTQGTAVYLDKPSDRSDELIAVIQGNSGLLSINGNYFSFVSDVGSTLGTAQPQVSTNFSISGQAVNGVDTSDFYSFTVDQSGIFKANLTNLTGDADIRLVKDYNGNGVIDQVRDQNNDGLINANETEVIAWQWERGVESESIRTFLQPGSYFLEVKSHEKQTATYTTATKFTPTASDPLAFSIQVNFGEGTSGLSSTARNAILEATKFVEGVISHSTFKGTHNLSIDLLGRDLGQLEQGEEILGQASAYERATDGTGLTMPVSGNMDFNTNYFPSFNQTPGMVFDLTVHEILHVLGFSLVDWERDGRDLLEGSVVSYKYDSYASRAYGELNGSKLPISPPFNTNTGSKPNYDHWGLENSRFRGEMMTGAGLSGKLLFYEDTGEVVRYPDKFLSQVTIAALRDLGWNVNYGAASPYPLALQGDDGNNLLQGDFQGDTLEGGAGNDRLEGKAGNDVLMGDSGDDIVLGEERNDDLYGGTGDDTLLGGDGADILQGAGFNNGNWGFDEFDILTGGAGVDQFVLGSNDKPFYTGSVDWAEITDFKLEEDYIQLYGKSTDYLLNTSMFPGSTSIIYQADNTNKLIGVVQGITGLNPTVSNFLYVSGNGLPELPAPQV